MENIQDYPTPINDSYYMCVGVTEDYGKQRQKEQRGNNIEDNIYISPPT
jgi:hypothetical protein